jgi:D-glycero-alpha-D-manno-heptose-7-phosphate kinase
MRSAKAPLRTSFFGGGSDLPMWRELTGSGGCVLSCTIDRYVHARPVAVYSDIAPGSGLGGSGAMHTAQAKLDSPDLSGQALFQAAWQRETAQNRYAGWQDVAASTFGGLNLFTFDEALTVQPIPIPYRLDTSLMLFGTGVTRSTGTILQAQNAAMVDHRTAIAESIELAQHAARQWLAGHTVNLGALMDQAWQAKRRYHAGVTNAAIDRAYAAAVGAGASGGKLCGAGGGGYLLFFVESSEQSNVRRAMAKLGLKELSFHLTTEGATLL